MKIVILSPPFYSHFGPLLALADALKRVGARPSIACTPEFEPEIRAAGMGFLDLRINRNANTGRATATAQGRTERRRLQEFLQSTHRGPIETLRTQNRHRLADMLANPEELLEGVATITAQQRPDLWVVDQLSYGATLALIAHGQRFVTFCPPHPLSIPSVDALYSVPRRFPSPFHVSQDELATLEREARELDRQFTHRFNQLLAPFGRSVERAFSTASPELIIHNYPQLAAAERVSLRRSETAGRRDGRRVYCGYCFQPGDETAVDAWLSAGQTGRAQESDESGSAIEAGAAAAAEPQAVRSSAPQRVVIALGTFLSARLDVLRAAGTAIRALYPQAVIAIGAGDYAEQLRREIGAPGASGAPAIVEPFIDQRELLRDADLFVHHGGVNSLTEALYYQVPMVVMPFSSDQFNVAADVEDAHLGAVLDPNEVGVETMQRAVSLARSHTARAALSRVSRQVRARGPSFAAREILTLHPH